jgi:hypothetical protein
MEYNTPLVATSTLINEYSSLPERLSFLNVDAENIHLSAMYPTENGIVIRIYDTYGRDVTANIRLFSQIEKVSQANLNEEVIRQISLQEGKEFSADVGRWRIETFLLQPQKASLMLVLASTSKMNVTQDERPTVTVNIKDRNDSPIREATVKAYVGNRSYQLTEANAGVYSCTIDLSSLEGNVTIRVVAEKEGYLSTEKVLVINVMMSTALPTYLLTAGVAFAIAIAFATAILILKKMRKSLIRMNLTQ